MPDAPRKDQLESPSVAVKPVLAVTAGALIFLVVMLVVLEGFYRWRVKSTPVPEERPFPAPVLETSITPRAVRVDTHGPKIPEPTRQLDPKTKPAPLNSGGIPLEQAMVMIAGRGAHAYDPVVASSPVPSPAAQGGGR